MCGANLGWTRSWSARTDPGSRAPDPASGRRAPGPSAGPLLGLLLTLAFPIAAVPQDEPASPGPPPLTWPGDAGCVVNSPEAAPRPPPETAPPPPAAPPPAPAPTPEEWNVIEAGHRFLSRGFLWAVVRFDRFFADERDVDLPRTRSFVRWRNTLAIRDDGRRSYLPDIRAEAVLPNFDRRLERLRLRLAVATTPPQAVDPLLPPVLRPSDVPNRPHAGLVLSPFQSLRAQTDFQTGALLQRPLGWYARTRFRRVQPLGEAMVARLALAGFWQTDLGFGTRHELSLEHPLSPWLLLRLAGGSMVAQRSRGWEWSSELALLAAAWPRTALSLSGAALGATRAGPGVEVWRVQARARHDVFRRWIFLEVAPEIAWSRGAAGHLQRASAVILRLEVQFDASSAPGSARAPAPPE